MSLAVLANHMASKGRNGDSMLVHMNPEEVKGLHALALAHGGGLTVNPETGLPEAFSLSGLLKAVLPAVAGFALGPAGFGIVSSALGAGALVGGATALATGSLQKGIMAGLGAYGGANLGGALSTAGMSAAQSAAATPEALAQITGPELVGNTAAEAIARNQLAEQATRDYLGKGFLDRTMGGISALGSEAGRNAFMQGVGGTSGLLRSGMAAAAPVMAGAMVPTTTPMPGTGGYQYQPRIRPMAFNQYGQTLEQLPMFSATGTTQQQPPGGMAGGGIVALAAGGAPKGVMPAEDFKKMIYAGGADDAEATRRGIEYLQSQMGYSPAEATKYWNQSLGTEFKPRDYFRVVDQFDVGPYASQIREGRKAMPFAQGTAATEQEIKDIYKTFLNRDADTGGLAFYQASEWSPEQIRQQIMKSAEYANLPPKVVGTQPGPITGGTVTPGTTTTVGGGQPITVSPVRAETIPGYRGTDVTYGGGNINQYVAPALGTPGKAYTGTQTIKDIRDEYTRGGGTTEMPTVKDFKPTVTGGSKAAYDYLMGQGPYPTNPVIPGGGPIMKPYAESVGMVQPGFYGRQGAVDESGRFVPTPRVAPGSGGSEQAGGGGGGGGVSGNMSATVLVYGPDGTPYASPSAALAAGVTNFSMTPPSSFTGGTSGTGSGTPITDFLFGKQDPNNVPVEDRSTRSIGSVLETEAADRAAGHAHDEAIRELEIQNERGYDPGYSYDIGTGYYGGAYTRDEMDMMAGMRRGGLAAIAAAGAASGGNVQRYNLGGYSDGGRLLRGPGDGVSDSIPATIGNKQPARLADGEFVIPARIVSEIGNGSTEAGARKLYAMMDRVQRARAKTTGKGRVAKDTKADKYLPA